MAGSTKRAQQHAGWTDTDAKTAESLTRLNSGLNTLLIRAGVAPGPATNNNRRKLK